MEALKASLARNAAPAAAAPANADVDERKPRKRAPASEEVAKEPKKKKAKA